MGRPLGIRSKPYTAISTADEEYEEAGGANATPLSPTIYQDDSGLSFEQDEEDQNNNSNFDDNYDGDNIATQSMDLQQQLDTSESQKNERCIRVKFAILFSFLAAMVIFGKEYYNLYGSGSGGNTKLVSEGLDVEEYNEVPVDLDHSNGGVRGKSGSDDNNNADKSSGGDNKMEGVVCQDDPNFSHDDVKHPKLGRLSCAEYVGNLDRAKLLKKRCEKGTGIMKGDDAEAVELLVKDFCKQSCGLCVSDILNGGDDFTEEEKELIKEQIEEDVGEGMLEAEEEAKDLMTEITEEASGVEVDVEELMDEDEVEELEDDLEEDAEFLEEEIENVMEKLGEAEVDDDGLLAEEKKEYIDELAAELVEDGEMQIKVEELQEHLEAVDALEEELEEVEKVVEDQHQEGTDKDAESIGVNDDTPDYFVPLTPEERDEMKAMLRDTLIRTKNALRMSASEENRVAVTDNQRTFMLSTDSPKQFMHMHHMKTGGTSVDGLIRCALNRQKVLHDGTAINYGRMSECGSGVHMCMKTLAENLGATLSNNVFYRNDEHGAPIDDAPFDPADEEDISIDDMNVCKSSESNVMSYCASLHAVRTFGWKDVDKITVIRNPIDRAWSMYRFTLNSCYKCRELKDVLKELHNGTFTKKGEQGDPNFLYEPNNSCAVQLIGHQSTNLLSSVDLYNMANDVRFPMDAEIAQEAIRNLREDFTWIGLTDRILESVEGFRQIFPFLAENLNDATVALQEEFQTRGEELEDNAFALPEGYSDSDTCPFEHRNAGRDPTCGTTELDDETKEWIMKLNSRDMAVYRAAVERFELQMEVLEEYKNGDIF